MTVRVVRRFWPLLLALGCSLEPNPSPYPMPGGADVWQPGRSDSMGAMNDVASSADTTSPGEDAIEPSDVTALDSEEDAVDVDDVAPTDVEELDATETDGIEDAEDGADDVSDVDVQTLMEGD